MSTTLVLIKPGDPDYFSDSESLQMPSEHQYILRLPGSRALRELFCRSLEAEISPLAFREILPKSILVG